MDGTKAMMALLSPNKSLRWVNIESQKDWDANMLDFGIVMMASSINGAKMLAFGLVATGESRNLKRIGRQQATNMEAT